MKYLINLFFTCFCLYSVEGYKILFYNPKFGISHVTFSGKVADTLAAAGHDVVVYQPVFNENITFTGSKHKNVRYYSMPKPTDPILNLDMAEFQGDMWDDDAMSKMKKNMGKVKEMRAAFCEYVLKDKDNFDKMRAEKFDLAITELFEACGLGVIKALGIDKYITTHGFFASSSAAALGIKYHPSYVPSMFGGYSDKMNFYGRLKNIVMYFVENLWFKSMFVGGIEEAIAKYVPGFSMDETLADSAFFFVNSDEHIDYPQPITHKIIYMGGVGKVQAKPLEKKFTDIFDSAKKGVILLSFGSVAQSSFMPAEKKKAFLEAFSEFPEINFIWKYEIDEHEVAKGYPNVFTDKWLPQNDILEHPRLLAFISHGGMNSVMEGSTKGVPMICIPIFGDQHRNAHMLESRGSAVVLDKPDITKANVVAAIKEIINNESYRSNAKLLAKMVKAKPLTSEERIVKYAEFAAQFGNTGTLQTQGRYQSFFVLESLDVLSVVLGAMALVVVLVIWMIKKVVSFVKAKFGNERSKEFITKKSQ